MTSAPTPRPSVACLFYLFAERLGLAPPRGLQRGPTATFWIGSTSAPCSGTRVRRDRLNGLLLASSLWSLQRRGSVALALMAEPPSKEDVTVELRVTIPKPAPPPQLERHAGRLGKLRGWWTDPGDFTRLVEGAMAENLADGDLEAHLLASLSLGHAVACSVTQCVDRLRLPQKHCSEEAQRLGWSCSNRPELEADFTEVSSRWAEFRASEGRLAELLVDIPTRRFEQDLTSE